MSKIWGGMFIVSFFIAIINGNIQGVVSVLFDSTKDALEICFNILGILCMWSGFMRIAEKCGLVDKLSKFVSPVVKFLFPSLPKNDEAFGHIAMNMTANILGLGNIATPLGIKAMERLQSYNSRKDELSNDMMLFVVLNTASIQLIPTSVIAMRVMLCSENPTSIVFPTILSSLISVFVGVFLVKIFSRRKM